MADKTVVQERENQCKAEIKETSSAQCPVSLKGRRPHAPRGSTVPLHNLDKSRRFSSFDRGHRELPHRLFLSMDVGLYAVSIENSQPVKGCRDIEFNILALVQYLENFVRAAPDNIKFPFMSIFRYQHPPSFTDSRHSNVSVHLQDHMHLASTFLGKHCTHRIKGTFRSWKLK